jgi:hypothetical protein
VRRKSRRQTIAVGRRVAEFVMSVVSPAEPLLPGRRQKG